MNSKFVSQGLQSDRYLKAVKLIEQFETEIERQLEHTVREIVSENQALFLDGADPDFRLKQSSNTVIAFARTDYKMSRRSTEDDDASRLKLSIMIHWDEASVLGHDNDNRKALSVTSLRIKNLSDEDYRQVKQRTRDDEWPSIHFGKDPWNNSSGLFYIPIETAEDIESAHETLIDHFGEYDQNTGPPEDNYASN